MSRCHAQKRDVTCLSDLISKLNGRLGIQPVLISFFKKFYPFIESMDSISEIFKIYVHV
jgi:hypothetical protein